MIRFNLSILLVFILTIDCTSKSTNEYYNHKNDKIIKLENDTLNKSDTQQKTTATEVKNQIAKKIKQQLKKSKEMNLVTLETSVIFHDGLVKYKFKKEDDWKEIIPQQKITGNFYLKVDKDAWILLNINNQEILIEEELETSLVDYLKNNKSNNSDKQTNGILELCQGIERGFNPVLGIERGGITFEQDFNFNCLEDNDVFFNENILINWSTYKRPTSYKFSINYPFDAKEKVYIETKDTFCIIQKRYLTKECNPCEIEMLDPEFSYEKINIYVKEDFLDSNGIDKYNKNLTNITSTTENISTYNRAIVLKNSYFYLNALYLLDKYLKSEAHPYFLKEKETILKLLEGN